MMSQSVGERLVEAARRFKGAPWEHQGRSEQGMDCCGFIVEVALASHAVEDVDFERDYRKQENGERMLELLQSYLTNIYVREELDRPFEPLLHSSVGDVLALCDPQLKYRKKPLHLAFVTELGKPYPKMIHASEHGVCEHRIDIHFAARICSVWRCPSDNLLTNDLLLTALVASDQSTPLALIEKDGVLLLPAKNAQSTREEK